MLFHAYLLSLEVTPRGCTAKRVPWDPPHLSHFCPQDEAIHDPQHTIRLHLADHFCQAAQKCSCLRRSGFTQAGRCRLVFEIPSTGAPATLRSEAYLAVGRNRPASQLNTGKGRQSRPKRRTDACLPCTSTVQGLPVGRSGFQQHQGINE